MSESQGRYVLRISVRSALVNHALNTWPTDKLIKALRCLADAYREEADDPEESDALHYLLESENASFSAAAGFNTRDWEPGIRTLVTITRSFLSTSLGRAFFLETLRSYHELAGDRLLGVLDLRDLSTLSELFSLGQESELRDVGDLAVLFWNEVALRGQPVVRWLSARSRLEKFAYINRAAVRELLLTIKSVHLSKTPRQLNEGEWQILGRIHYAIAKSSISECSVNLTKRSMIRGFRHMDRAIISYQRANDDVGINDCRRLRGSFYNSLNAPGLARKEFLMLFRSERDLPGFDPFKAAGLHNLFMTFLHLGAVRRAEGLFWEANYQYSATNRSMWLVALGVLAHWSVSKPNTGIDLPDSVDVARKAEGVAPFLSGSAVAENVYRATDIFCKTAAVVSANGNPGKGATIIESIIRMVDESYLTFRPELESLVVKRLKESIQEHIVSNGNKERFVLICRSARHPAIRDEAFLES